MLQLTQRGSLWIITVVTNVSKPVGFVVEENLAMGLDALGTWCATNAQRPDLRPPVLRRRGSSGYAAEVGLVKASWVLRYTDKGKWHEYVQDYSLLVDAARRVKTQKKPKNGVILDCRLDNWPMVVGPVRAEIPDDYEQRMQKMIDEQSQLFINQTSKDIFDPLLEEKERAMQVREQLLKAMAQNRGPTTLEESEAQARMMFEGPVPMTPGPLPGIHPSQPLAGSDQSLSDEHEKGPAQE